MALQRPSFSPLSFLCFQLLAALHTISDAALSSHQPQAMDCSTSGNYTSTGAFAANLNQFLSALPENAVSKNGGFFNSTVGKGADTVYGLAMCSADYSRSDCGDCLAATASSSNANGLLNLCPGSTTVLAWFDPCLVRYSDTNFFGRAEIGPIYKFQSASVSGDTPYSDAVVKSLKEATANAVTSPHRFAATLTDPYTFVQCTWDLPPDQCKQCLDVISTNATEYDWWTMKTEGKRKSHSCALRYSNTSFVVTPFDGAPMPQSIDQAAGSHTQSSGVGKGSLTIGVVGSVVGLILLACLAALIWKVLKLRSQCRRGHVREFTYRELASATREFAGTRKLGQGAFGVVYKGAVMMQDKEVDVAIKKNINAVTAESRAAFKNEVDIMKPLNHLNIIRLVGWCDNRNSLLLVYELVEDRNLEDRLYGGGASVSSGSGLVLDWRQRYNILVGIASGLDYLHNKCAKTVLHRDIKPGNVMLDRDFNAKLCDFGLVTQLTHAVTSRSTNNVIGTQGYMDPSFEENGKVIRESDVYSFGVLLLEVVCGVKPKLIAIDRETKNSLVDMVREYKKRNAIVDAADQHLRGKFDDQIKGALLIGLNCVETSRGDRPTIQIVLSKLSGLRDSYVVV